MSDKDLALSPDEEKLLSEPEDDGGDDDAAGPEPDGDAEGVPEPEGEPGVAKGKVKPPKGFVPHGALAEERARSKLLQEQLESFQVKIDQVTQNQAALAERERLLSEQGKQPEAAEQPPDPKKDIIAYMEWQQREIVRMNDQLAKRSEQEQRQTQVQQVAQQLAVKVNADAEAFTKTAPDFNTAVEHLRTARDAQLAALAGVDQRYAAPQYRALVMQNELRNIALQAVGAKKNVAEQLYSLAQAYGYEPGKSAAEGKDGAGADAQAALTKLSEAQERAKSLSQAGGRSGTSDGRPDLSEIVRWPHDKFERWMDKPENREYYDQLLEGA